MRDVVGDWNASISLWSPNQTRPPCEHVKSAIIEFLFSVCKARWNLLKPCLTSLTRRRCSKYKTVGSLEPLVLHVLNFLDVSAICLAFSYMSSLSLSTVFPPGRFFFLACCSYIHTDWAQLSCSEIDSAFELPCWHKDNARMTLRAVQSKNQPCDWKQCWSSPKCKNSVINVILVSFLSSSSFCSSCCCRVCCLCVGLLVVALLQQ